ncbi:MAG: VPLPA-CTERM sorting domain-containing protein [Pseudomonadota bacterium]
MKVTAFWGALAALATLPQAADAAVFRFEIDGIVNEVLGFDDPAFSVNDPFRFVATIDENTPEMVQNVNFSEYALESSSFSIDGTELSEFNDAFEFFILDLTSDLFGFTGELSDPQSLIFVQFSDENSAASGDNFTDTSLAQVLALDPDNLLASPFDFSEGSASILDRVTNSIGTCSLSGDCSYSLTLTSATFEEVSSVQAVPLPAAGWLLLSGLAALSLLRANGRARA